MIVKLNCIQAFQILDKFLTENCGFLDNIDAGDFILADRGFDLADTMALLCANIKIPSFMKGNSQLSLSEVINTRKIANVRIYVERVIGSMGQRYGILNGPIPLDYLITKDLNDITTVDKILSVCCCLSNVSKSAVSFDWKLLLKGTDLNKYNINVIATLFYCYTNFG